MPKSSRPHSSLGLSVVCLFDLARRMEGASLDAGCGPDRARGLGEAASAIGDEHGGRGNPHHEGSPRLGAFALREMPGEDVASAAGDEDDGIALEPDAVEEHDIEDLSDIGRDGPYLPYP